MYNSNKKTDLNLKDTDETGNSANANTDPEEEGSLTDNAEPLDTESHENESISETEEPAAPEPADKEAEAPSEEDSTDQDEADDEDTPAEDPEENTNAKNAIPEDKNEDKALILISHDKQGGADWLKENEQTINNSAPIFVDESGQLYTSNSELAEQGKYQNIANSQAKMHIAKVNRTLKEEKEN